MDRKRIEYICQGYLNDTATTEELQELEVLLKDPKWDLDLRNILEESYYKMPFERIVDYSKSEAKAASLELILSYSQQQQKSLRLWPRLIAAAVVLIVLSVGLYYYKVAKNIGAEQQVALLQKVGPGKNGATLTLSDGRRIALTDAAAGAIANEAGITITKTTDGSINYSGATENVKPLFNTISTKRGETYQLTLPDGSKVWLNAASSLSYQADLNENGERKVRLLGEAYFEVAKRPGQPFIVVSEGQTVRVLGTHFNVSAYADDKYVMTTLLEGSVNINGAILKPNDQSLQENGNISIKQVDTKSAVDWKNGVFICKKDPLEGIMKKVSRWYDVEVAYADPALRNKTFSGSMSRYDKVEDFLEALKFAGINSKIENRKIMINN